jgi:hypothetical protein
MPMIAGLPDWSEAAKHPRRTAVFVFLATAVPVTAGGLPRSTGENLLPAAIAGGRSLPSSP